MEEGKNFSANYFVQTFSQTGNNLKICVLVFDRAFQVFPVSIVVNWIKISVAEYGWTLYDGISFTSITDFLTSKEGCWSVFPPVCGSLKKGNMKP